MSKLDFSDFKRSYERLNEVSDAFNTIEEQIDLAVTAMDDDEQEALYEGFDKIKDAVYRMLFDMVAGYCEAKRMELEMDNREDSQATSQPKGA